MGPGIRLRGRPRTRWEDKIKINFREVRCEDRKSLALAQTRKQ